MKIFNKKEQFIITFDNKEFIIPSGYSECDTDLFGHIWYQSRDLNLDVVDASQVRANEEKIEEIEEEISKVQEEIEEAEVQEPVKKAGRPKKI